VEPATSCPRGGPLFTPPDASAEQVGRTTITLSADTLPEIINTELTFSKAGTLIASPPSTLDLKLDLYRPTGFFTGSFKIREPVPGAGNRFVRRTVPFSGMMVPQLREEWGFFHLSALPNRFSDPPTTSATAPIFIGEVSLK
jgi:hypothetical protein